MTCAAVVGRLAARSRCRRALAAAADVPRRRRSRSLRRRRHRQAGHADHRPDGGRLRGHRGGQAADDQFFAAGGRRTSAPPLHLGFLLDTSGSMEEDIKDVRTAAIKFLNAIEHAVDITLVDFDTEVRRRPRSAPSDYPRLIERIRMRKPDGWTALYDAIGVYLNGAADQDGEKVLVIYTDGGDTRSSLTVGDVLDLLKARTSRSTRSATSSTSRSSHGPRSAMQLAALRGDDRRAGVLPDQLKELDEDVREDPAKRSPPATASATCRPTRGPTARGARSRSG